MAILGRPELKLPGALLAELMQDLQLVVGVDERKVAKGVCIENGTLLGSGLGVVRLAHLLLLKLNIQEKTSIAICSLLTEL